MDEKKAMVYSEVDAFLNAVDEEKRNRIPEDLRKMIKSKKDKKYNPRYNAATPLNKLKMLKESRDMINLLNFNYWCESEQARKKLKEEIANSEKETKENLWDKIKNIFKK